MFRKTPATRRFRKARGTQFYFILNHLRVRNARSDILQACSHFGRPGWVNDLFDRTDANPKPTVAKGIRTLDYDGCCTVAALLVVRLDDQRYAVKMCVVECVDDPERVQAARNKIARAIGGWLKRRCLAQ
jgi:hypothetical protein